MATGRSVPLPPDKADAQYPVTGVAAMLRPHGTRILEIGLNALSWLNIGFVLCSAAAEVLLANPIAEEILRLRDGLELSTERTLYATQEGARPIPEIVRQVAEASNPGGSGRRHAVVAIQRAGRRRPLTALITTPSRPGWEANSIVLVMILNSASPVRDIETELRQLYGFTSTEARLANLMMEGRALEDCCKELGICRSTGCTHLRKLFKKMGVHRQSELVGLLLKGIGLAYLGGTSAKSVQAESKRSSTEEFES